MSEIQTITNISDIKNQIKESIKTVDTSDYTEKKFGEEEEYTYKGLLGGVDSLLTDITSLIKAPKQFVKLSIYQERQNIVKALTNVQKHIADPHNLWSSLDELKQAIRPFHIRYTKERLIDFDNELSELTKQKQKFSKSLNDLQNDLDLTIENKDKANKIVTLLQENINSGEEKLNILNENINSIENNAKHISNIKNQSDGHKELIDNFVEKIVNRGMELEKQTKKTNNFNAKLAEFIEEREDLLQTAKILIQKAKTALGYKKAEGIAAAFRARLHKLESTEKEDKWYKNLWIGIKNPSLWWIIGSVIFSGITIFLSYEFIQSIESNDLNFNVIFARLSTLALPIAGTWFCAEQYIKIKNIAEDYAYKTVLVESMIGFSEQLKDKNDNDETYKTYMEKMLNEIHQHPLKNHKKQEIANPYKKILDDVENLISKNNTPS